MVGRRQKIGGDPRSDSIGIESHFSNGAFYFSFLFLYLKFRAETMPKQCQRQERKRRFLAPARPALSRLRWRIIIIIVFVRMIQVVSRPSYRILLRTNVEDSTEPEPVAEMSASVFVEIFLSSSSSTINANSKFLIS